MSNFPGTGHLFQSNFENGLILVNLDFDADGRTLTFTDAGSKMPGMKAAETVAYTAVEVRPQVFLVHWQENDRMTVVHLEDFERGVIHSRITAPTGEFYALSGVLEKLR